MSISLLDKAYKRSESLATANYGRAVQMKQAGELPIVSSMDASAFGGGQKKAADRKRYQLFRDWTYSAVNAVCMKAAGQPVNVARLQGANERDEERNKPSQMKQWLEQKMPPAMRTKNAGVEMELLIDHPLIDLLDNPNDVQNRWQFVYTFVANLNLTGWGYLVGGETNGKMGVWSIPTTWITPIHKDGSFSKYRFKRPGEAGEGVLLDRENVAFAHLPDPANLLGALSPAEAQMNAVRIDDHIQTSQEAFFENGIFPSMVVTIGKNVLNDGTEGPRPVLTPAQRRQVIGAISKQNRGVANYGGLGIIDGLVERFDRFSATQNEMGWEKSEKTVRTRILSAFGVHPFILGEPMNVGGYSQAVEIKGIFCDRVNSFLEMLSGLANSFMAPMVEQGERLKVWWELCIPKDPSIEAVDWREAAKRGDVTRNETRARLGLPPDEAAADRAALLSTVGGMTGAVQVLTAMGNGFITPEIAAWLLSLFFEIPIEAVTEALASSENQVVGEVIETLQAAVREIGSPIRVDLDHTGMDKMLVEVLAVAEEAKQKALTVEGSVAEDNKEKAAKGVVDATKAISDSVSSCVEKAVGKFELAMARQGTEEARAETLREVLSEMSKGIGESLETIQKASEQPVIVTVENLVEPAAVNVVNEVKTPAVNVENIVEAPEVFVENQVETPKVTVNVEPDVTVVNEVSTPIVKVEAPKVSVTPEITVEGPTIEVQPAETKVVIEKCDPPTHATIIHQGGSRSEVELKK